jgi:hypothetical protein
MQERSDSKMPWKKTRKGYRVKGKRRSGTIKRPKQYEALRRRGMSKKTAARIANKPRKRRRKK